MSKLIKNLAKSSLVELWLPLASCEDGSQSITDTRELQTRVTPIFGILNIGEKYIKLLEDFFKLVN